VSSALCRARLRLESRTLFNGSKLVFCRCHFVARFAASLSGSFAAVALLLGAAVLCRGWVRLSLRFCFSGWGFSVGFVCRHFFVAFGAAFLSLGGFAGRRYFVFHSGSTLSRSLAVPSAFALLKVFLRTRQSNTRQNKALHLTAYSFARRSSSLRFRRRVSLPFGGCARLHCVPRL
jgi:hypothetical protein